MQHTSHLTPERGPWQTEATPALNEFQLGEPMSVCWGYSQEDGWTISYKEHRSSALHTLRPTNYLSSAQLGTAGGSLEISSGLTGSSTGWRSRNLLSLQSCWSELSKWSPAPPQAPTIVYCFLRARERWLRIFQGSVFPVMWPWASLPLPTPVSVGENWPITGIQKRALDMEWASIRAGN